jgi:hypothetical protein
MYTLKSAGCIAGYPGGGVAIVTLRNVILLSAVLILKGFVPVSITVFNHKYAFSSGVNPLPLTNVLLIV